MRTARERGARAREQLCDHIYCSVHTIQITESESSAREAERQRSERECISEYQTQNTDQPPSKPYIPIHFDTPSSNFWPRPSRVEATLLKHSYIPY